MASQPHALAAARASRSLWKRCRRGLYARVQVPTKKTFNQFEPGHKARGYAQGGCPVTAIGGMNGYSESRCAGLWADGFGDSAGISGGRIFDNRQGGRRRISEEGTREYRQIAVAAGGESDDHCRE